MKPRPIRILHVITSLAGGAGLHVYQLARHLDRERFSVRLVYAPGYPLDAMVENEGLPRNLVRWRRGLSPIPTLRGARDLWRILSSEPVDILHAHCSLAGILGRCLGRLRKVPRIFFTYHEFGWRGFHNPILRHLFLAIERSMDRFTDHYFVTTENYRREIIDMGISIPEKISVIPLGIDVPLAPSVEQRLEARRILGLQPADLAVATAGRLEPQKGIGYLLKGFHVLHRELPSSRLLIFGDGPARASLQEEARIRGLGGAVRFLGWRTDVRTLLPGVSLFCLPSLWESFSYALLETMAAEVPILATRVGGVPEVVEENRCAILVPPGSSEALAEGMVRLLREPQHRLLLASAGRRRVEANFTLERMVSHYESAYMSLTKPTRSSISPAPALGL